MSKNNSQNKKMTASQRLNLIEQAIAGQEQKFNILAEEIDKTKQMISGLAKRVIAIVDAGEQGELNNNKVDELIIAQNVKELENNVKRLEKSGLLTRDDESLISENTFLVGQEKDKSGKIVNPRVQFSVKTMPDNIKASLLGKKVGDSITYEGDNGLSLVITESYGINQPNIEKNFDDNTNQQTQS